MTCRLEIHPRESLERDLRAQNPCGLEMSLVEVVLLACDASEDAGEIDDLVGGVIDSGAARVLPREQDPMLAGGP